MKIIAGSAEYQQIRASAARVKKYGKENLVQCRECELYFHRVGSHVVQAHGYSTAREYYDEHGMAYKEGSTEAYRKKMCKITTQQDTWPNLNKGKPTRFKKHGTHGLIVSRFWANRRMKK